MITCKNHNEGIEAVLSSCGDITSFSAGDQRIQFRTSPALVRYVKVKEWDDGYIVVDAEYKGIGEVEEYIDLIPILQNLYVNREEFLRPITSVRIEYAN